MKTLQRILMLLLIVNLSICVKAQENELNSFNQKALQAYTNSNIFMWKQLSKQADQILNNGKFDEKTEIEAIKIKYGLLYACLSNQDENTYEQHIENTLQQLDKLLSKYPESSDLYSISASLMSVQMGFSPMKGMTLGSLSSKHIDESIKLDSLNAMAWRQYASSKYFTPKMWGGDIQEAIEKFNHSIALFEQQHKTNDWMYVDAIVWLGIAYQKVGEIEKAKAEFEKALEIAPEFGWVKNQLLPGVSQL